MTAADDQEIYATPMMQVVPALVTVPQGAIDTLGTAQGVVVGAANLEGFGGCLFIGTRMKDGTAMIAAVPSGSWIQLAGILNATLAQLQRGEFDLPQVAQ